MTKSTVYLDSFSTTALAPEVCDAMLTAWREPANAGSPHSGGARAAEILDDARTAVAGLIGANPSEIVFTSGATEANNLVIFGVAGAATREGIPRRRIVVSAIEHKSVQESARALIDYGFELIEAPVCHSGQVDLEEIARLITENTLLVSVMAVNNEIGVIQPINKIAGLARSSGAFFHCDAAQAVGKIPVNVFDFDVDYLSISAHKMHGPCGVGALFIASDALRPHPILFGGGQEGGLRSGTVPVPLVAGFGAAACLARSRLVENSQHAETLSEQMVAELLAHQVKFSHVPSEAVKLPGSLALCFHGVDADSLVEILARDVHVSTGSACTSGQIRTSHVLKSIGISDDMARSVIRMLFGRYNNSEDVRKAALLISIAIKKAGLATGGINQ